MLSRLRAIINSFFDTNRTKRRDRKYKRGCGSYKHSKRS